MSTQDAFSAGPILIVGAGITGLILAQGLKKAGLPFVIFEKDSSLNVRSNEWTMAIHWSLDRLEKILPASVWAAMEEASCNPDIPIDAGGNYPIIHGESGNILAGVPYKKGLRVPRSKMRSLCSNGLESDIRYGMRLIDVAFNESGSGVLATFDDGSIVRGSVLIGADGPRSQVRAFAVGSAEKAAPTPFPIWHMNLTVCYNDAEKARFLRKEFPTSFLSISERSFHSFQSISSMPEGPDHPEKWVFHIAVAWLGEADHTLSYAERLAIIKEKAQGLAEPARSSLLWIPDGTLVHKADISYWVPSEWANHEGRMTLVGDAAHSMPPYRGQGLNHCICDISHLLESIASVTNGETGWKEAIAAYEGEMIPRGAEEVKCSLENGHMLHDWSKVMQSPVFKDGFRPMKGHDSYETNSDHAANQLKAEEARKVKLGTVSAH